MRAKNKHVLPPITVVLFLFFSWGYYIISLPLSGTRLTKSGTLPTVNTSHTTAGSLFTGLIMRAIW